MSLAKRKKKKIREKKTSAAASKKEDRFCTSGWRKHGWGWNKVSWADKFPPPSRGDCLWCISSERLTDTQQPNIQVKTVRRIRSGAGEAAREGEHAKDGRRLHKSDGRFCQRESLSVDGVANPVTSQHRGVALRGRLLQGSALLLPCQYFEN